jgi:IS605 OrfB family transposase
MNETDQKCDRKRLLKIMKFSLNVIEKNDGVNRLAVIKMLTDEFGFKLTTEDLQLEQNHKKLKQFLSGTPNAIKGAESIFYKFLIGESRRSKEKFVKKLKEEIRKYECDDELISSIKIMQSLNIYNHFNYKNECLKSAIANISKTRKASFNQYVERKKLEEKLKTVEEVVDKEVNRELINAVNHFKSEECRKIAIREKQEGRMPSNEYYLTTKQISNADTFFEYVQKFDTRNEALIEFKKKVTHGDINLYEFLIHNYFKLCKEIGKIEKSVYEQLGNLVKLDGCERNLRNLKHPIYRHYDINTCPAILWFVGNSGIGGEIIPEYNDYNLVTAGASNRLKKKIRRKECGERLFKVKFELFNKSINEFEWRSIICHGLRIDVEILQGLRNDLKNLELSPRNHPLCINDGNQYVRTDCSTISFNIDSNNYEKLNIAVTLNCKKPKDIKESDGFKVCSIDQGLRMPIAYAITEVSKSKCKESISLMGHNGEESGYYIKVNNVGEMKIPGYPDENILRPGKNLIFVTNEQRKILTDIIACQKEINKNFSDENQYNNFNKEIPRRDNLLDFQLDVVKSFRRLTWSLPPLLKNKKNKKEIKPYYEKVKSIYEKVGYLILGEKFCFYEKKNMSEKIIKINQELSSRKSRSNGNLSDKRIEILFTLLKGMKSLVAKCKLNDEEHAWFPIHGICGNIDKLQEKHTNVRRDRANKSGNGCMKLVKNNKCTMIVCEDLSNLIPSRSQSKGFNVRLSNWLKQRICTTIKNQSSLSGILMKKVIARNTSLIDWTQEAEGLSKPDTHRRINLITKEELSNKKDEYIRSFNYCLKGNSSVAKALKWFCDENDVKTGTRIVEKLLSCNHDWMEGNKIIIPHKSGEYYFRAKFCGAKKLPFSNKEGWKIINSDYSGAMTIGVRGIRNALGLKKREGICLVDE